MRIAVDRVVKAPVAQTIPVIGRFVAQQHGDVAALIRGPVGEVLIKVGDRVVKGQILARLVNERLKAIRDLRAAELGEKRAAYRSAEAQLQLAQGELARLEKLRKSAAYSKARRNDKINEVNKYKSEMAEADATVGQAQANLRLAEIDLYNTEIRAPYDAMVAARHVTAGNFVNVGSKIATLINDQVLEIEADVPANRLAGLQVGRTVRVLLDDGSIHDATTRALIPTESAMTRTRPVRFVPLINGAAPATGLAADQSVTVLVPVSAPEDLVTVHKDAVIVRAGVNFVFVATGGTVQKRIVELGRAAGNRFEVLKGLKPGDIVAVRGNEKLRPGQTVDYDGKVSPKSGKPMSRKPAKAKSG
ncbi:MAG: efflux RND transporter periplasmic adaptor subunit [Alphaproteobacteria bacterium]|nr:efflux RND transporter periplasmic adaptor subunit [Alphaproteobacteria bacterium]